MITYQHVLALLLNYFTTHFALGGCAMADRVLAKRDFGGLNAGFAIAFTCIQM
jgi:hypothetical protein